MPTMPTDDPQLPPLIDTHCHLSHQRFSSDRDAVIAKAQVDGVGHLLCIATSLDDGVAVQAIVAAHPQRISWSIGLDPFACHQAGPAFPAHLARLRALLTSTRGTPLAPKALGEIGLEHHHRLNDHAVQIEQFAAQLDLAAEFDLPVVIHTRDATPDTLAVLRQHPRNRGVIHSFIGTADEARAFLDLGWHLSFNGTVTFKANEFLRQAAAIVPADRLLIETDAPYLAPMPLRGQRCEPGFVRHTLAVLADVRAQRIEDAAAWTTQNAVTLFGLPAQW